MKTKYKYLVLFITISILLIGCKKDKEITQEEVPVKETIVEEVIEVNEHKNEEISPLSGIYVDKEKLDRRIIGVMFDNHPRARWQSGLKDAEIVYEYEVEAPYTRYLGLFLSNDPESIGPIRSARPYFVTTILEYDALYVRVGGSGEAEEDIIRYNVNEIDARKSSSSIFWRKTHKKAPNNLYSDMDTLRNEAIRKNLNEKKETKVFSFNREDQDASGLLANEINIVYNNENSTDYIYNEEEKLYYRKKDGENHIDEIGHAPIKSKNIIIRQVDKRLFKDGKKLEMDLIGQGKGKYITNGMVKDISWIKNSREDRTIYKLENGQELKLNPGVTFIQVVSPKTGITIN